MVLVPEPGLSCMRSRRNHLRKNKTEQQLCPWLFLFSCLLPQGRQTLRHCPFLLDALEAPVLRLGPCSQLANFPQELNKHFAVLSGLPKGSRVAESQATLVVVFLIESCKDFKPCHPHILKIFILHK